MSCATSRTIKFMRLEVHQQGVDDLMTENLPG